jgi:hypothetical protein
MRCGVHSGLFCVELYDLLDPPCRVPCVPPRLKEPSVVWVGGDVSPQCRGERLAEKDDPILVPLAAVDPDFAGFKVHVGDLDGA